MKNIKTTIIIGLGLTLVQATRADTVCSVQTLGSLVCGDGKVEVRVFDDGSFKLHHGDVHCWGQNTKREGDLNEISPDYNDLEGVKKFELLSRVGEREFFNGTFKINKEKTLARVKLEKQYLSNANATDYNLTCRDQSKEEFVVSAAAGGCLAKSLAFESVHRKASKICSRIKESYVAKGSPYVTKEEGPGCWSIGNDLKTVAVEMKFTCGENKNAKS